MKCLDFSERLHEHLDRRAGPLPDELLAHARACIACQHLLQDFERLDAAVAVWNGQIARVTLTDAVLARMSTSQTDDFTTHSARTTRPSAGWFVIAAAMALLLMFGIGWQISEQASLALKEREPFTIAKHSPISETAPPLDELFQDARDAYAVLASQAWQQATTTNLLLVPPADGSLLLPTTPSLDELPETLTQPLSPIGHELRDAVNSLWNRVFHNQESST